MGRSKTGLDYLYRWTSPSCPRPRQAGGTTRKNIGARVCMVMPHHRTSQMRRGQELRNSALSQRILSQGKVCLAHRLPWASQGFRHNCELDKRAFVTRPLRFPPAMALTVTTDCLPRSTFPWHHLRSRITFGVYSSVKTYPLKHVALRRPSDEGVGSLRLSHMRSSLPTRLPPSCIS